MSQPFSTLKRTTQDRRTARCNHCYGRGEIHRVVVGPDGRVVLDNREETISLFSRRSPTPVAIQVGRRSATVLTPCRCTESSIDLGTRRHGMVGTTQPTGGKHGSKGRLPKGTRPTKPTFCSYQPEPMTKEEIRRVGRLNQIKKDAERKRRQEIHKLGKKH